MATFLDLPPEMGGTQFGPFTGGMVQIGTDQSQCQIVLPPQTMGIAPVHVQVAIQSEGQYLVAPVAKGVGLFVARAGTNQVQPVPGATQAAAGDTIILGNLQAGPRFTLRADQGAQAGGGPAGGRGGGRRAGGGMANGVAREMSRVARSKLLARNPMLSSLYHSLYRMRTGGLRNPRIIVGLIGSAITILVAAVAGCGGLYAALQAGLFGN